MKISEPSPPEAQWEQDNSSTEQFIDTFFETTRSQIMRQLVHRS